MIENIRWEPKKTLITLGKVEEGFELPEEAEANKSRITKRGVLSRRSLIQYWQRIVLTKVLVPGMRIDTGENTKKMRRESAATLTLTLTLKKMRQESVAIVRIRRILIRTYRHSASWQEIKITLCQASQPNVCSPFLFLPRLHCHY